MRTLFSSPRSVVTPEDAEALPKAGAMAKLTMRNFDMRRLTPVKPLSPRQITAIRRREKASPASFAFYLGVSVTLVSQWERGEKKPSGPSLKLLTLVQKNGLDYVA